MGSENQLFEDQSLKVSVEEAETAAFSEEDIDGYNHNFFSFSAGVNSEKEAFGEVSLEDINIGSSPLSVNANIGHISGEDVSNTYYSGEVKCTLGDLSGGDNISFSASGGRAPDGEECIYASVGTGYVRGKNDNGSLRRADVDIFFEKYGNQSGGGAEFYAEEDISRFFYALCRVGFVYNEKMESSSLIKLGVGSDLGSKVSAEVYGSYSDTDMYIQKYGNVRSTPNKDENYSIGANCSINF